MAEINDASIQNTIVKPRGLNSWPVIPSSSARGRNTTQVVSVPPRMEAATSPVPSSAASKYARKPLLFVDLKQLSSTTIELSTIIPTPKTRELKVMTFNEKPINAIRINDARIDTGIELPTIRDAFKSPKNKKMMTMDMITAMISVSATLFKELLISSLLSWTTTISRLGLSAFRFLMVLVTALVTSMALFFCCFLMDSTMVSLPL